MMGLRKHRIAALGMLVGVWASCGFGGIARADAPSIAPVPAATAPVDRTSQPSGAAPAATRPAAPATQPVARPALPVEFAILQTRNVFGHGAPKAGGPGAAGGVGANFVLKGVVEGDGRYTAFIEDKSAKRVASVATGEAIAVGRIKSINLDAIEYEAAGNSRRIEVGQNLNGEIVPPTPTTKPAAGPPPGTPGAPGQPGQPGGPPPGRGGKSGGPPGQPVEAPAAAPQG
jgi:hypothetical protein